MTHANATRARRLMLTLILPLIGACAQRAAVPPGLTLQTLITDERMKLFEMALPPVQRQLDLSGGNDRQRRPAPEIDERRLRSQLEQLLQTSGFCREGYTLLGRYAGETTRRLRGECRERATDEDRARYPNTISRW